MAPPSSRTGSEPATPITRNATVNSTAGDREQPHRAEPAAQPARAAAR